MDSTSESLAKTKSSRGILARACMAKTMIWELKSAKGVTIHDTSGIEALLSQAKCEAKKVSK